MNRKAGREGGRKGGGGVQHQRALVTAVHTGLPYGHNSGTSHTEGQCHKIMLLSHK